MTPIEAVARALHQKSMYSGYDDETKRMDWLRNEGIMKSQAETVIAALQSLGYKSPSEVAEITQAAIREGLEMAAKQCDVIAGFQKNAQTDADTPQGKIGNYFHGETVAINLRDQISKLSPPPTSFIKLSGGECVVKRSVLPIDIENMADDDNSPFDWPYATVCLERPQRSETGVLNSRDVANIWNAVTNAMLSARPKQ